MAFKNIAISGRPVSGSTSLAKTLAAKLGWPLRDASQMFRGISKQMGFNLEEDPQKYGNEIDLKVDRETTAVLTSQSLVVVASKLAGFLSRNSSLTFRVLVICPFSVRVNRCAQSRGYDLVTARRLLRTREKMDQEKWEKLYGRHDFFDHKMFHLILDAGKLSIEEEAKKVVEQMVA